MRRAQLTLCILACLGLPSAPAILAQGEETPAPQSSDRMDWWREARFGLFIHWGLYAIPAGEWGDATGHGEWIMNTARIPVERYEQYVAQFDPVRFDADEWVQIAKDAGMRYIVITSKHHDGFCLFDSEHTDYDVMSTPFQRDILRELAEACRRHGLEICWYHSIMDWHHPDYLPRRGWEQRSAEGADFDRYVEHLRSQVTELLSNYGRIGVMWFDGEWEATWTHEHGRALYELCRSLQPDVIVNNRVDKGRGGMAGMTSGDQYGGDFGTPEQEIPRTGLPGVDWETCMTMNRHWGYNKHDLDYKSSAELVRMLVDIASKGGNFLLNVGPTAEGTFPPESVQRLREIGAWMKVHGEAIYGTSASPFEELPWGRCTMRSENGTTSLYLHVFDWPEDGRLVVPGLGNRSLEALLLGADRALPVTRDQADLHVTLPGQAPDPTCSVVRLQIEGDPVVYRAPRILAPSSILVHGLSVEIDGGSPELEIRYTLDGSTPGADAPLYQAPLELRESATVKARSFHDGQPVSAVAEALFRKVAPWPAAAVGELAPGLRGASYGGEWDALPDFNALQPDRTWVATDFDLGPGPRAERVGHRYLGYLVVPQDDVYRFALTSDDGSRLLLDGHLVVDNDGLHGAATREGVAALAAGPHRLTVEWFNKTGGAELELQWARLGAALRPVSAADLRHAR